MTAEGRTHIPHECEPVYVTEGECVCFECGSFYIHGGIYDAETLDECRQEIRDRLVVIGGETLRRMERQRSG